jgi:predicted Zn-dependent protease
MGRNADALRSMLTAFRLNPADRITVLTIVRFYKSMDMIQNAHQLLSCYLRDHSNDAEMANELASLGSQTAGAPEHAG